MHNTVAQQLYEYVRNHPFRLPYTNAATLLEWLYICYAETQEQDPPGDQPKLHRPRYALRTATSG